MLLAPSTYPFCTYSKPDKYFIITENIVYYISAIYNIFRLNKTQYEEHIFHNPILTNY